MNSWGESVTFVANLINTQDLRLNKIALNFMMYRMLFI